MRGLTSMLIMVLGGLRARHLALSLEGKLLKEKGSSKR